MSMQSVKVEICINKLPGPDRSWLVSEIERITGKRVIGQVAITALVAEEERMEDREAMAV